MADLMRFMAITWMGSKNGVAYHHPDMYSIHRAMVGFSGGVAGAYLLKPEWADFVFDRVRELSGPFKHCRVVFTTSREFFIPTYFETSRVDGQRHGGVQGRWRGAGATETESMTAMASNASLGMINFLDKRLFVYFGPVSRDLLADAPLFEQMANEAVVKEFRYMLEYGMLLGKGMSDPLGVINSPACVVVPKDGSQTPATISATNVEGMWDGLSTACQERDSVMWHCNSGTLSAINKIATSAGWPEALYIPSGRYGNKRATLHNKPLIPMEMLPAIGQPGDLVLVDWGEYVYAMRPIVDGRGQQSVMETAIGLPGNTVELTKSEHVLFDVDEVAWKYKLRADGRLGWPTTMKLADGSTVGPCAIIAAR
jgi:HK97 family phage major capsid protein